LFLSPERIVMRPLLHCCRLVPVLVLLLFLVPSAGHGAPPGNVSPPARVPVQEAVQENGPAEATGPGVLDQLKEMPEERPAPIRTEQIDRAGEQLGLRVGVFGLELAPLLGNWINRDLAWGITWLKLLFCLALFVLILAVERLVRWLIKRRLRLEATHTDTHGWYALLLRALSRPLSLFLFVYGSYGALSPLFSHLNRPGAPGHLIQAIRWAADAGGTVAALWFLHRLLRLLDHQLNRWARTQQHTLAVTVATLSERFRAPLNLLVLVVFARLVSPLFGFGPALQALIGQLFGILLIAVVTWLTVQGLNVLETVVLRTYHLDVADNLRARKMHTQIRFLKRLVISLIVVLAGGSMLMVFDRVRQLGTSILASAGIIGIVVGLAAQRSITNMLVGLQIALTQPIRLDDVVIVEGEWGRIEEITTTYVVGPAPADRALHVFYRKTLPELDAGLFGAAGYGLPAHRLHPAGGRGARGVAAGGGRVALVGRQGGRGAGHGHQCADHGTAPAGQRQGRLGPVRPALRGARTDDCLPAGALPEQPAAAAGRTAPGLNGGGRRLSPPAGCPVGPGGRAPRRAPPPRPAGRACG
jgi:hypothetical protein